MVQAEDGVGEPRTWSHHGFHYSESVLRPLPEVGDLNREGQLLVKPQPEVLEGAHSGV